jgi:hypothetical protein
VIMSDFGLVIHQSKVPLIPVLTTP